jgi:ATP-binding cassette subfamily B protein
VRNADMIYVMEEGVLTEWGVHEHLVANNGTYAALWRVQTGEVIR